MRVKPLVLGLVAGAVVAWFMSSKGKGGFGPANITGGFASPFQAKLDQSR